MKYLGLILLLLVSGCGPDPSSSSSSSSNTTFAACGTKTTCSQMQSCSEAYYFLNTCGINRLDGNNNGVPCETICGKP